MLILVRFSEITLKGKNRTFFEDKLKAQIKTKLKPKTLKKISGGFLVESESPDELHTIFGITNYAIVKEIKTLEEIPSLLPKKFKTFAVRTKRSDKKYPLTSQEVNIKVGNMIDSKVDLDNPELTINLDIVEEKIYFYTEKIKGPGGLPLSSSGSLISMISSGIDSPVSSYLAMKRGCKMVYTHFHSYPHTSKQSVENVKKIVKQLNTYQGNAKLYSIGIGDIQKKIVTLAPAKYRILLYRRLMLKLAANIARREKVRGIVTGESIGQVASQTLPNMHTTSMAVDLPIYRPLISYDKQEIIDLAKKIGTYEISILPYDDCCSFLIPKQVAISSKPIDLEKIENEIGLDELLRDAEFEIIKI